ncbi:MAG TPA: DUF5985 family protein [Usitatibacter sp.]|jgi:hypothetical protein|nr:DUF5985 family protein [Usitatibacter sp.]
MSAVIYTLCALTSLACVWFLMGAYARTRHRLLFWSGLCFVMLTVSNILNIFDRFILPNVDLVPARLATALVAVLLLIFGLIWEGE